MSLYQNYKQMMYFRPLWENIEWYKITLEKLAYETHILLHNKTHPGALHIWIFIPSARNTQISFTRVTIYYYNPQFKTDIYETRYFPIR